MGGGNMGGGVQGVNLKGEQSSTLKDKVFPNKVLNKHI